MSGLIIKLSRELQGLTPFKHEDFSVTEQEEEEESCILGVGFVLQQFFVIEK